MSVIDSLGMVIAKKWIAGEDLQHAIQEAKRINSHKESVIMNYLGEDLKSKKLVEQNMDQIMQLLDQMHSKKIKGSIAVKPTQTGLIVSTSYFEKNYSMILAKAQRYGITVWLDMEQYRFVPSTINTYLKFHKRYKNTGVCIQAKLKRSLKDVERIAKHNGMVRLVKGAYKYPSTIAFQDKRDVYNNYLRCMEYLFSHADKFMIASHDDKIIKIAINSEKKYHKRIAFGMLKGVRSSLAAKIAESEDMNIYLPYGEEWIKYSMRRLSEWEHTKIIIRSIIQG